MTSLNKLVLLLAVVLFALAAPVAHAESSEVAPSGAASGMASAGDEPGATSSGQTTPRSTKTHSEENARINEKLERLLGDHRFCHDADYQVGLDEYGLCQFADAAKARCPAIAKACENPFAKAETSWNFSLDWLDMEVLGQVLRIVVWLLVFATLGLVVYLVVRRLVSRETKVGDDSDENPEAGQPEAAPPSIPAETDVERLLANARQAAQQGDFYKGLSYAFHALLRHLDQKGFIEIHRSKTNGDYRLSLAEQPGLASEFTDIARTVERVQFGSARPDEATFHVVLARITRLVTQGSTLIGLLMLALSSSACSELGTRQPASALGCGETLGGYSVLCEMLAREGSNVRRRIQRLDKVDEKVEAIIVLEDANLQDEEWDLLDTWVSEGHTLVLTQVPSPLAKRLQVFPAEQRCKSEITLVPSLKDYYGHDAIVQSPTQRALSEQAARSWTLAECDAGPTLLGLQHGDGTVLLLPGSRLLTNVSLASADNAWLVTKLFVEPGQGIEVVGSWTGAGSSNPLEALQNARLTPWLLQLLLLAILLAWWKGARFGLPRDATRETRHAFVEHIEALGFLYAKSKASRFALANYGAWALGRLQERLLPGARASMSQLAHALASLTGREETRILEILIAARSAQDEAHDTLTTKEHLDTMKELSALLKATGGTR